MIQITERAAKEIKTVMSSNSISLDTYVRVGIKGGGCSGYTYILDFESNDPDDYDIQYNQHELNILVDKKSDFFLTNVIIDFNDGLLDRGFTFTNPDSTGSCGCGTSFSV